jgi:hypothetical protein
MIDLFCIAKTCRDAFDKADLSSAPGYLPKFPNACCGWACRLIGYYLKKELKFEPLHVCASRGVPGAPDIGHEWIELNGTIIDITADQFSDQSQAVIVTNNSTWHQSWQVNTKEEVPLSPMSEYDESLNREDKIISTIYETFATSANKQNT